MDYYRVLGVPRNCSRDQLHHAFRELSKTHHPDRFNESERDQAEKRYQQIVIAFNKLKNPKSRELYDKMLSTQPVGAARPAQSEGSPEEQAQRYARIGQSKMQAGDYEQAAEAYKRAVHFKESAEYYYQKAIAESKTNHLQRQAAESLQMAINKAPRNVQYQLDLVRLFDRYRMHARAKSTIDKVVERFPGNEAVMSLAEEINPDKYKKGLLGGFFGKKKGV